MLSLSQTLRTVAYLEPQQIFWQIIRRVQTRFERIEVLADRELEPRDWMLRESVPEGGEPPVPPQSVSKLNLGEFRFLNSTKCVTPEKRWDIEGVSKLWLYNLHYFDWLWSFADSIDGDWDFAQSWVQDWIDSHKPTRRAVGWEPYPTSLRLINWCLLFFSHWRERTSQQSHFLQSLRGSLGQQLSWLYDHLEYHIQANHLLENAAALAICGRTFGGELGERAYTRGNKLFRQQLREQILTDGMHYERSAMYHCRVLWLTRILSEWGDTATCELAQSLLPPMQQAMDSMTHIDGRISQFNDAADKIYRRPEVAVSKHASPSEGLRVWALPDAGFYGAKNVGDLEPRGQHSIVCNCGTITPRYQPGHAHADSLSFEWCVAGQPLITDTGVYDYEKGESRRYDRSTRAHNTVEVNRSNSSEVWSSFRVGQRANVRVLRWEPTRNGFSLVAEHDGYLPVIHQRSIHYSVTSLLIEDRLSFFNGSTATSFLHFSPHCVIYEENGTWTIHEKESGTMVRLGFYGEIEDIESTVSAYSPEFGLRFQRPSLAIRLSPGKTAACSMQFEIVS